MRKTIQHKIFYPYGDNESEIIEEIVELFKTDDFWKVKLVIPRGNRPVVILERNVIES